MTPTSPAARSSITGGCGPNGLIELDEEHESASARDEDDGAAERELAAYLAPFVGHVAVNK